MWIKIAHDSVYHDNFENHHQLLQELEKCHQSLGEFLMPLNTSEFNQISNSKLSRPKSKTFAHLSPIINTIQTNQSLLIRIQSNFKLSRPKSKNFNFPSQIKQNSASEFNQISNLISS